MSNGVVIVGASHAGVQVAASLREQGYEQAIKLINGEAALPYQRPPLSKGFVDGKTGLDALALRSPEFFKKRSIELLNNHWVTGIDRDAQRLNVNSPNGATEYHYDHLVLATGAEAKPLSVPGTDLPNVLCVRSLEDAVHLKEALVNAHDVVIAGAGFISLEVASTLRQLGKHSSIIVRGNNVLSRTFPSEMADFIAEKHRQSGSEFLFNTQITQIEATENDRVIVHLNNGDQLPADLVVVGIGTTVNDDLGRSAGLDCDDGILVSRECLTSDPNISACGDCAAWQPFSETQPSRIESVQMAIDQGKTIAARLTDHPLSERVAPWFWSEQLDMKLQMVGTTLNYDDMVCRGSMSSGKFSLLYYQGEKLVRVDSVNSPADHLAARKLVTLGRHLPKELAAKTDIKLKTFI